MRKSKSAVAAVLARNALPFDRLVLPGLIRGKTELALHRGYGYRGRGEPRPRSLCVVARLIGKAITHLSTLNPLRCRVGDR